MTMPGHTICKKLTSLGWSYEGDNPLGFEIYTRAKARIHYYPDVDQWEYITGAGHGLNTLMKFLQQHQYI